MFCGSPLFRVRLGDLLDLHQPLHLARRHRTTTPPEPDSGAPLRTDGTAISDSSRTSGQITLPHGHFGRHGGIVLKRRMPRLARS